MALGAYMNRLWLCFLILCVGDARAAGECVGQAMGHADQRECWSQLASSTAGQVAAAQKNVTARIERLDEEQPIKDRVLQKFAEAEREFEEYRMAQCEFEASTAAGGNGAGDLRLQCEVRLNRAYAARLKQPVGLL